VFKAELALGPLCKEEEEKILYLPSKITQYKCIRSSVTLRDKANAHQCWPALNSKQFSQ